MTKKELEKAVRTSVTLYGRDATIQALNKMYHKGLITIEQVKSLLDALNK